MKKPVILLTGVSGNVGSEILKFLVDHHKHAYQSLRIGHYNRDKMEKMPLAEQADELVVMDMEKPETFAGAFQGTDTLFLLRPPHLTDINNVFRPLLKTAIKYGVKKIIFLSVQGAENNKRIPHHKIENLISELGVDHIFVRPSYFMQNLTTTLKDNIEEYGKLYIPSKDAKFNWIDVEDIGRTTAKLLVDFEKFKNSAYTLTGPENLSFPEVSDKIREQLDIRLPHHSPPIVLFFLKQAIKTNAMYAFIQTYLHVIPRFSDEPAITNSIELITGQPASPIEDFLNKQSEFIAQMVKS